MKLKVVRITDSKMLDNGATKALHMESNDGACYVALAVPVDDQYEVGDEFELTPISKPELITITAHCSLTVTDLVIPKGSTIGDLKKSIENPIGFLVNWNQSSAKYKLIFKYDSEGEYRLGLALLDSYVIQDGDEFEFQRLMIGPH